MLSETVSSWEEATSTRVFLKRYLSEFKLSIDKVIFDIIDKDDAFEVWSPELKNMGCSRMFFEITSHSAMDLLTRDWKDLFTRDDKYTHQLISSFQRVLKGEIVFKPCEDHEVQEIKSNPVTIGINTKALAPVYDENKNIVAVVCILKFIPVTH
jgi:hypothetical protein